MATPESSARQQAIQAKYKEFENNIMRIVEMLDQFRGAVRVLRETLREVLEDRFGTLPDDVVEYIEACEDINFLKLKIRQVAKMDKLNDLSSPPPS